MAVVNRDMGGQMRMCNRLDERYIVPILSEMARMLRTMSRDVMLIDRINEDIVRIIRDDRELEKAAAVSHCCYRL